MLKLYFFANTLFWPFTIDYYGMKIGLNIILLSTIGVIWIVTRSSITNLSKNILYILLVYFAISFLWVLNGVCTDKISKMIFTVPIFILFIILSLEIGFKATIEDWLGLKNTLILILIVTFLAFGVETLVPSLFPIQQEFRIDGKYSGIFNEPSHVAFSIFPIMATMLVSDSKKNRYFGLISLLIFILVSRSSTLLAIIFAWSIYYLIVKFKFKYTINYLFVLLCIIFLLISYDYYDPTNPTQERIKGILQVDATNNISSLVYVQGWEDAWLNLLRTNGTGLGFNMMGCFPLPESPTRFILSNFFAIEANSDDGSILLAKLISEMGLIGGFFLFGVFWWLVLIEVDIKKYKAKIDTSIISLQTALIFSIFSTFFIRSASYFSGGFLLLIVAIAASYKWRREIHKNKKINKFNV